MKFFSAISLLILLVSCQSASKETPPLDGITFSIFIEKPIEEVFQLYTTKEGLEKFLAPNIKIDFGNDSLFYSCNELNTDLTEPGHVTNSIVSYIDNEMLHFKIRAAPPYLPYANELHNLNTMIKFRSTTNGTEVEGTTYGFDKLTTPEEMKKVFSQINAFTFEQLKNYSTGNAIKWEDLNRPHSPEKRYKEFISDSIWYKTYRLVNNTVVRPMLNKAFNSIEKEFGIGLGKINLFYFILTNFDQAGFNSNEFSSRYPFVKNEFVSQQLDLLVNQGLLSNKSDLYYFTNKAREISDFLVRDISLQSVPILRNDEVELLISSFSCIVTEATKEGYSYLFPSLIQKKKSLFSNSQDPNLKLAILIDDLTAMRNDASHYRFKNLNPYLKENVNLSSGAEEVMARVNSEPFTTTTYSNRPTWGFTELETKTFMSELEVEGLVLWSNENTVQITDAGKELHKRASIMTEKVFYTPWLCLSYEGYQEFKILVTEKE